jgi:hypothetical protein
VRAYYLFLIEISVESKLIIVRYPSSPMDVVPVLAVAHTNIFHDWIVR